MNEKIGIISQNDDNQYGGFWVRAGAFSIDSALQVVCLILIVIVLGSWNDEYDSVITFALLIAYTTFFLSLYGTTPGKMLYGLHVVDSKNEKINFRRALVRSVSYLASSFLFGLGFLNVAFDKEKHKALHDHIAGTSVLRKPKRLGWPVFFSIISISGIFSLAAISSESSDSESAYEIRSGTREIRNNLSLNSSLFDLSESPDSSHTSISNQEARSEISDQSRIRDQLAAVVEIACPIDGTEDDWKYGSGVFLSDEGLILTNNHVVDQTTTHYCTVGVTDDLSQNPKFAYMADTEFENSEDATKFTFNDSELDIALLRVVSAAEGYELPEKFPVISSFGSSDALNFNDQIFVVGYPGYGGGTLTFTEGVMSGRVGDDLIKTSAKIDSGNSGGAAFNQQGEFIGVPTLVSLGTAEGLGYIVGIDSITHWFEAAFKSDAPQELENI